MKHVLTILALLALSAPANAQIDKSPWYGVPTNPSSSTIPSGSADFQYPNDVYNRAVQKVEAQKAVIAQALKSIPLPPVEFDHPYSGEVVITKWNDYTLLRSICKDVPTALGCSLRTYNGATGAPISCLIMLGPAIHNDERALRHEMAHCNGWPGNHENAR
jgi:hypothetical protein